MTELLNLNPYQLASDADCMSPDTMTSAGASFLLGIRAHVHDVLCSADADAELLDASHEIADSAVPIYTHELWSVFVDLGAYAEDPTDLGFDGSDMEQGARLCLYTIAQRLADVLIDSYANDYASEPVES